MAEFPTIQPIAVATIQPLEIRLAFSSPTPAMKAYNMNEAYAWIPAEIKSYKALYKGRQFWVFENDFDRPYDIYDDPEWHQILLFDCEALGITATGYWTALGNIHGCVMWGQGVDFIAKDPADMVSKISDLT